MAEEAGTPAETTATTTEVAPSVETTETAPPLLNGQEGGAKAEGAKDPNAETQTETKDEKANAPEVPEAYEFKVPEGFTLDAAAVEAFTPILKDLKLGNADAQKLMDGYAAFKAQEAKASSEAWEKQQETWASDFQADKEFGGDKAETSLRDANLALSKFATPEEIQAIRVAGLANFNPLVKMLARAGRLMSEGNLHASGSTTPADAKALGQKFYPEMNP